MRTKLPFGGVVVAFLLLVGGLVTLPVQAGPPAQGPPRGRLSTPELIDAARASGEIGQDTAYLFLAYALGDYEKLPLPYRSDVPWDGTLPLLRLQEAVKAMKAGRFRTEIMGILSGTCGSSVSNLPNDRTSTHFYIEYPSNIAGGLTINDYETSLETTWSTEVDSFDWAAPPLVSIPSIGNRYHVRVDTLGGRLYGYVTTSGDYAGFVGDNTNTSWHDGDAYATCMVLNRDYSTFPGTSQQALDATTAHELNHSIQFGYGALTGANEPDDPFSEGGATWMEDEVHDSADDNYNYLWPTFDMCMGQYTNLPYPYWITFRGLTERYGTGTPGAGEQVMQDFWEETSKSATSNMLDAVNTALTNKGTNLADAYHAYAIAVKFNKSCGGGYVHPYCFEEAAGYVSAAGSTSVHGSIASVGGTDTGSIPDNYALNWVSLPTGSTHYDVTLQNTSTTGGQLRGSVVCDTGSALNVNPLPSVVGFGNSTTLTSFNPTGCSSVVAVLTNQSQTAPNPTTTCVSRNYTVSTAPVSSLCYTLTLTHTGSGADPVASTSNSSGCSSGRYVASESIETTANPAPGWHVASWNGTANDASTAITNSLTMPASDHSVTVNYEEDGGVVCYTLALTHTGSGADPVAAPANSSACSSGRYLANESVETTASPAPGWHVASWSGTANDASTAITNSLTMPASDHSVAVTYEADSPVGDRRVYLPHIVKSEYVPQRLLVNCGFESGNIAWVQQSGVYPIIANGPQPSHSGDWSTWFAGYPLADDRLYQSIQIPEGACPARQANTLSVRKHR